MQKAGLAQLWQAPPAAPQSASWLPGWQTALASQQPLHWSAAHGWPQPSSAPAHLPAQLGAQQDPPELHSSPPGQQTPLQQTLPQPPPAGAGPLLGDQAEVEADGWQLWQAACGFSAPLG